MQRSIIKSYAPFIALAVMQAAFVVWIPSKGEQRLNSFATPAAGYDEQAEGSAGGADSAGTDLFSGGSPIASEAGGVVGGSRGSQTNGPASGSSGPVRVAGGDTSHCKGGRQTDVIYNAPPCIAKFVGDNGGATYPGVTRDGIRFVMMQCQDNEQIKAITSSQGLGPTEQEYDAMGAAGAKFINERYETYGRKVSFTRMKMDCPTNPPDPPKYRQAAAEIAKTNPAFVWVSAGNSWASDTFAEKGVVNFGNPWNDQQAFAGRRPFRWDTFATSTETGTWTEEYYCKKMARKAASNAGTLIHPDIGRRDTQRKLGIIVKDDGSQTVLPAAQALARKVKTCGGHDTPIFTYQGDVNRATEQARVISAGLIDAKVTTVACLCDPIFPVFFTQSMTQNNYYPEHLITGMGLIDFDVLGRVYDPAQWNHAFGMSQFIEPVPHEQSDAAKIWRAAGNEGSPCVSCILMTNYMVMMGSMIQLAGPNLNPGTIEAGLVGSRYSRGGRVETRGNPHEYLVRFGPGDYNAFSDFREVYWDASKASTVDGKAGAYVSLNGGRRYSTGELTNSFEFTPKPA